MSAYYSRVLSQHTLVKNVEEEEGAKKKIRRRTKCNYRKFLLRFGCIWYNTMATLNIH